MNAPIRLKDPSASGRQYTFSFGFGGLAALVTGLTLALSLFFVLGVLVGRGHRPETAVPVVAGIMPKESVSPRPVAPPEVLKPEELGYPEQLGQKHEGPAPARGIDADHKPKAEDKKPGKAEEKKADARKPEDRKVDKLAEAAAAKAAGKPGEAKPADAKATKPLDAKAAKPADKKSEAQPDPDTRRYDYAYQTATFPDADSARAHLKRIKALGLKGDVESGESGGKTWHRVVVFFRGTPTETRGLKAKLAGIGVDKLVMRSKVQAD